MYDILTSQFNDVLAREGKTITSSTGNTYQCVFRKNSDKNNSDNRLTIFYPAAENIEQGQLLKFKDNYFLSLNQETIENEVYKKSDLLQVNTEIHTISSGYELYIRAYAEDATSLGVTGNSTITSIGGNINLIAQDDSNSRRLAIDATFTALGGTWKITNIYFKSGLCYIFTSRTANSTANPTYALSVTGGDTCTMEESTQMTATATITDSGTTTTILNPTIVDKLKNDYQYSNMYKYKEYDARGMAKKKVGFVTNGKTKPLMINTFVELFETNQICINSKDLLSEMKLFSFKDGKMEATAGNHDDLVMSFAMALVGIKSGIRYI